MKGGCQQKATMKREPDILHWDEVGDGQEVYFTTFAQAAMVRVLCEAKSMW